MNIREEKMFVLNLELYSNICDRISSVAYNYSYLIGGLTLLFVMTNAALYCDVCKKREHLISLWKFTAMIYIVLLLVGLIEIPITIILEYTEQQCTLNSIKTISISVWIYVIWSYHLNIQYFTKITYVYFFVEKSCIY